MTRPSALALPDKIAECERAYAAQHLPTIFKITEGTVPALDAALADRGYDRIATTDVMTADLTTRPYSTATGVITAGLDEAWFDAYAALSRLPEQARQATRWILAGVTGTMVCGRLVRDDRSLACGELVVERGYAGLQDVIVDAELRGQGLGRALCESLMAAAQRLGAHTGYLQVVADNHAAVTLYEKLGFTRAYSYWYRIQGTA